MSLIPIPNLAVTSPVFRDPRSPESNWSRRGKLRYLPGAPTRPNLRTVLPPARAGTALTDSDAAAVGDREPSGGSPRGRCQVLFIPLPDRLAREDLL
jgi:hypothetical protein